MGRHRRAAQQAERARAEVAAAQLRVEARRWWIRAVFAVLGAVLAALVTTVVAGVLGLVAIVAVVQGFRVAVQAQRVQDAG